MNFDEAKELIEHKTGVWIKVEDDIPKDREEVLTRDKNGICDVLSYSDDLYTVDEFDFYNMKGKSGFYDYDSEFGYFVVDDIIEFMYIPE